MSIEKLPNGNYRAIVFLSKSGGKQKRITRTFILRKDAKLWETEKEREKRLGTLQILDKAATFYSVAMDFLDKVKERDSPNTYTNYKNRLEKHVLEALGPIQIQLIQAKDIMNLQQEILSGGLSVSYAKYITVVVSSVFDYAIDGVLQLPIKNPCKQLDKLKVQKKILIKKFLNDDEISALLDTIKDNHYGDLVLFLLNHGVRISEACRLQVGKFNKSKSTIVIDCQLSPYVAKKNEPKFCGAFFLGPVKNHEPREIYLNEVTKDIILRNTENKKKTDFIFKPKSKLERHKRIVIAKRGRNPEFMETFVVNSKSSGFNKEVFKKMLIDADLDEELSVHNLRDTFATHFYRKTKDLYALKKLLGHKSIVSTQIYADIFEEERNKYSSMVSFGKTKGSMKGSKDILHLEKD